MALGRTRQWLVAGALGLAGTVTGACAGTTAVQRPDAPVEVRPAATKGEALSTEAGFQIDRPANGEWDIATDVLSPEGRPIPVVVAHPISGAQIVVQVSELSEPPEQLAQLLRAKLAEEGFMELSDARRVETDAGADAYGFDFKVEDDALGRVALIEVAGQIVLVVASWPKSADDKLVNDIDTVVRSVRPSGPAADPVMMRPDKA